MTTQIIVVRDSKGEINVHFCGAVDHEEHKKNGEEILASYPLEKSLIALGILAGDHNSAFGQEIEALLTKIVVDSMKF